MTRRFPSPVRAGLATLALASALALSAGRAEGDVVFDVSLNTAPLVAHPGEGPYALDFTLTGTQANTVTITNVSFGAGGSAGSPVVRTGGATGSLTAGVTLSDSSAFFNDFNQGFTPGALLTFRVTATTHATGSSAPDNFSMSILTRDGLPIPTTDSGSSTLLFLDLTKTATAGSVQVFRSDTTQTFSDGTPVFPLGPPTIAAVPEPSALALVLVGVVAFGARTTKRRRLSAAL